MSTLTRIRAVVVDTERLTVYREDGSSFEVPQGDSRVQKLLKVLPDIEAEGYAEVDLSVENPYREYEQKSGGFTRFFRVLKSKVAGVFAAPEADITAPTGTYGDVPVPTGHLSQAAAVDEIMRHATPMAETDMALDEENETVVAVTAEKAVIPDVHKLKSHIHHANKLGSPIGVENFLRRLGTVIERRGHSVEDLMRFMERADLPIADDGTIIAYKVLRHKHNEEGVFVDCHTGKVPQRVGSVVQMDEKLVDPSRRNECSNGLHIARRGYLKSFGGDVCVLAKIAPEDVIAVPNYDSNKVRVCRYHILTELSRDMWNMLVNGQAMTSDSEAQKLVGRAISGDHIGVLEYVTINSQMGGNVTVTPAKGVAPYVPSKKVRKAVAVDDETVPQIEETKSDAAEDQAALKQTITANVQKTVATLNARQQKARNLMDIISTSTDSQHRYKAATELYSFKKTSKVSWGNLGLSDTEATQVIETAATVPEAPAPKPEPVKEASGSKTGRKARLYDLSKVIEIAQGEQLGLAAQEMLDLRKGAKQSWTKLGYPKLTDQLLEDLVVKSKEAPAPEPKKSEPLPSSVSGGRLEQARGYFTNNDWANLWELKRKAKVSWLKLGFSGNEISIIEANKPK